MRRGSRKQNGMSIVGQGGKIALFALPSLLVAVSVHVDFPQIAALPRTLNFLRPVGVLWFLLGLILSGTARVQVRTGFAEGRLVTTGVYAIVRNPIYSSLAFFLLPGLALITLTWVYLVVSVFVYVGVILFIGKEEEQLAKVFGKEYEDYRAKVDRLVPFKEPRIAKGIRR
jgi:protein-S-isoprenylcysteine O-methyltransferase Ste14